ncbi:VOC family protein [Pseudoroseicyclus tamaricis]|uniref:Glyoxalase n=1 Tax=Pseudoroseicyclus tamaricis TaxID=2705421 RepID=A0A6B2JVN6_9RHOB|nr:VOC family protein [Pseudoroseicyclus tamaricis]NDV02567.1 glyoxalase [Pseudoroseicyclus tamaricis]
MSWRLDHVQLAMPAGGEDACRAFWVDVLGMTEVEKPAGLAGRGGLWLRKGAVELHLGVAEPFAPATKAHPCFAVPGLDTLAEALEAAGHTVRWDSEIAGRRRFFTDDPFGNRVEFMAEA